MSHALAARPTGRWSAPTFDDTVGPQERRWPAEGRPAIILPEPPPAINDFGDLRQGYDLTHAALSTS